MALDEKGKSMLYLVFFLHLIFFVFYLLRHFLPPSESQSDLWWSTLLWKIYSISKMSGTRRRWSTLSITLLLGNSTHIQRIHWTDAAQDNLGLFHTDGGSERMRMGDCAWNRALRLSGSLQEGISDSKDCKVEAYFHFLSYLCQCPRQSLWKKLRGNQPETGVFALADCIEHNNI